MLAAKRMSSSAGDGKLHMEVVVDRTFQHIRIYVVVREDIVAVGDVEITKTSEATNTVAVLVRRDYTFVELTKIMLKLTILIYNNDKKTFVANSTVSFMKDLTYSDFLTGMSA